jgi:soluble lytic murein transglycosylase
MKFRIKNSLTFIAILTALILVTVSNPALSNIASVAQRKAFQAAEKIALSGKTVPKQLKAVVKTYPLYPYIAYAELKTRLHRASTKDVSAFLATYADTPLASLLRNRWIGILAGRQDWSNLKIFYEPQANISRQCHYLNALLHTGKSQEALDQVESLWLYGKSRPKACDPLFKAWKKAGLQTPELTWQRIALAMDKGQIKLARYLKKSLPFKERAWVDTWIRVHNKPGLAFTDTRLKTPHPQRNRILKDAAFREIRKNPLTAIKFWEQLQQHFTFSIQEKHLIDRKLALWLVRNPDTKAISFMAHLQPCGHDSVLQEALIRSALIHQDWSQVLSRISHIPAPARQSDRWRYWLARAFEQTHQSDTANKLYASLATERSYYGFLAADRVGMPYHFSPSNNTVGKIQAEAIEKNPAVIRAKELLAMDRFADARREWRFATRKLNAEEYVAAAELAQSWNWHDQAIFTLAKSKYWDDLELRFPLQHKSDVKLYADKNKLDMSWVYGVIRQESAFNAGVRSYAGAMGLMQLMPATARYVAKTLLKKKHSPKRKDLINPKTNIELGTAYLADVFSRLGENPVLATAAYNAGPHRVKRWLPENHLPADIWVELIPFKETRGYVQRVFTYAAIYDHRLNRKLIRLSERMPLIQGTESEQTAQMAAKNNAAL